MQIKHVGHFKKDLLENDFVHEKCPITVLISSVEFYKSLEIWFGLIWIQYAKSIKETRKQKRKGEKKEK
jgi:hypothetical protein